MKVLVTGAAGFLGSHVIPALLERGDEVVACDVLSPDLATRLAPVMDRIEYKWKAVADIHELEHVDQVVHLSGLTDVPLANSSPRYTFQLNVDAAMSLFIAAKQAKVPVMAMSTENVYGAVPPERLPAKEDEPPRPKNSYAASKVAVEAIGHFVAAQYGVPVTFVRSSTLFGPRMRSKQVVAVFARQAIEGKPITLEGDGSQTRDFNYVDNMIWAILNITQRQQTSELPGHFNVFNIGSGEELSLKELVTNILSVAKSSSSIVYKAWRPGEEGRLSVSIQKAHDVIGYEPQVNVYQGLEKLVASMKA